MVFRTITKAQNKKRIMVYYVLAIIFVTIGLIFRNPTFYVVAVAFLGLALIRKHWLHKRLDE